MGSPRSAARAGASRKAMPTPLDENCCMIDAPAGSNAAPSAGFAARPAYRQKPSAGNGGRYCPARADMGGSASQEGFREVAGEGPDPAGGSRTFGLPRPRNVLLGQADRDRDVP